MPVRNAPLVLPTALRFIGSRLSRRLRGERYRPPADFRARVERVLSQLGDAVLRHDWVEVVSASPAWIDTGITLAPQQVVSVIASGMLYVSRPLDVGVQPKSGLWLRVGEASEIGKLPDNTSSFRADARGGALRLAARLPGAFDDRAGRAETEVGALQFSGAFEVVVVQWKADGIAGLRAAARLEPELFGPALKGLEAPALPPAGWHYLWRIGQGQIYTPGEARRAELCCHTNADVGILQFPVDRPLTEDSAVSWSWCVEQLPSKLPEHIEPTHDYLSLAVEFDNGLDLTWMWSVSLPVDTIFQCPLAWWKERETHWVVRSGTAQLGQWVNERRSIADDYRKAIGGELPKRIVGVWLISNSVFQRGEGRCRYRDIALDGPAGRLEIGR